MCNYLKVVVALLFTLTAWSQEQAVKVLFDVTSSSEKVQQAAIRHAAAMSAYYPNSTFEVVVYGGASAMTLKGESTVAEAIGELSGRDNVKVVLCRGTMKRKGITEDQLLPGVGTVPDAIMELASKQQEGWSYIKEGN